MAEIARNNTGLSGGYFVAAELYRRGWSVGLTIGNSKAVDLFAEKNNVLVQIQVKSIYKKKHNGWPMMKRNIKKDCLYIFVNLNGDTMGMPDFYICTSREAKKYTDQYSTRGIVTIGTVKKYNCLGKWEKMSVQSKKIIRV
jgi:hypothetical protein